MAAKKRKVRTEAQKCTATFVQECTAAEGESLRNKTLRRYPEEGLRARLFLLLPNRIGSRFSREWPRVSRLADEEVCHGTKKILH